MKACRPKTYRLPGGFRTRADALKVWQKEELLLILQIEELGRILWVLERRVESLEKAKSLSDMVSPS